MQTICNYLRAPDFKVFCQSNRLSYSLEGKSINNFVDSFTIFAFGFGIANIIW